MVRRDIRDYLNDILIHIDLAQSFVKGMTFHELQDDDKTMLALTRAVEIIGEASKFRQVFGSNILISPGKILSA